MTDFLALARAAAVESHGKTAVGELSHTEQEAQDGVLTYFFESKLKGYPDWHIAVTLFIDGWDATVSEVVFAPGQTSLVAPKWIPWSERLADYKALQAALEAEAAAAVALAEDETDEDDEDIDAEGAHVEDTEVAEADEAEEAPAAELAVADVPEAVEAEDEADSAGGKAKGFFKWKTLRGSKKRK